MWRLKIFAGTCVVLVAAPQLALSWARLGRHWQLQEEAEKWWRGEQEEGDSRHSHLHIVDIDRYIDI